MNHSKAGYTLVEILVVIFILSIVSCVALLSLSQNQNKQLETFANDLAQTVMLAEEQAMLQPTVLGLKLGDQSFQFSSFQLAQSDKANSWKPLQDSLLGKLHRIPGNVEVSLNVKGASKENPQIIISTNGELTPFSIYVGKKGAKPRYVIMGDADGTVTSKLLS